MSGSRTGEALQFLLTVAVDFRQRAVAGENPVVVAGRDYPDTIPGQALYGFEVETAARGSVCTGKVEQVFLTGSWSIRLLIKTLVGLLCVCHGETPSSVDGSIVRLSVLP